MPKLTEVSLNLSHKSLADIEDISKITNETDEARVVSIALHIANELLTKVQTHKLIIRDKNSNDYEMKFVIDP